MLSTYSLECKAGLSPSVKFWSKFSNSWICIRGDCEDYYVDACFNQRNNTA